MGWVMVVVMLPREGRGRLWVRWEMVRKPIEVAEQVGGGVEEEEESVNGWGGAGQMEGAEMEEEQEGCAKRK
ncbi:hypothetical protein EYF80_031560 [Liparis tanakae]|uniref:Uncharacterized protein n=1 Tax=Liparis tanakae TaxID=230148 RepID=A0A4Z2GY58_9TELE|nr:hypothetical protein EYF80_031560 [Liparis tanakae]